MSEARALRMSIGQLTAQLDLYVPSFFHDAPRDADGNRVFLPALRTDTVHEVTRRVQRMGGAALVVFVRTEPDGPEIDTVRIIIDSEGGDADIPISGDCTFGDLLSVLISGASITYKLDHGEITVDERFASPVPPELAPA